MNWNETQELLSGVWKCGKGWGGSSLERESEEGSLRQPVKGLLETIGTSEL